MKKIIILLLVILLCVYDTLNLPKKSVRIP